MTTSAAARCFRWVAVSWLMTSLIACDHGATADTPSVAAAPPASDGAGIERPASPDAQNAAIDQEGLLIGEYRLAADPVIDGDTIRVEGIDKSIRLLALDTEERFHGDAERAAAARDFDGYLKRRRGDAKRPTKTGTPMGEQASAFAEAFFAGAESVRLERDDPKELRGRYGRLLAYALVKKEGRWTSFNVECVRAGMSPYFTKYGYSRRFHNQLSHAEAEAKQAKRGIWNPNAQGYGDYEERKAWWNARADFIRAFEHEASRRSDFISLSHWDAPARLEASLGERVTVLSTVGRIDRFKRLVRVSLDMESKRSFPIIFFDKSVFDETALADYAREPIRVRGRVERYTKGSYSTLQIVVDDAAQVTTPKLPGKK
jgi:endonuclease YncB( thermonuclease family)